MFTRLASRAVRFGAQVAPLVRAELRNQVRDFQSDALQQFAVDRANDVGGTNVQVPGFTTLGSGAVTLVSRVAQQLSSTAHTPVQSVAMVQTSLGVSSLQATSVVNANVQGLHSSTLHSMVNRRLITPQQNSDIAREQVIDRGLGLAEINENYFTFPTTSEE